MIHVNELKFQGEDNWTKQFNLCSDLYSKAFDESLPNEEKQEAFDQWIFERQRLETGNY